MAKLASVEDLRRRGGFKSIDDLLETLASYLEAATFHLAEALRIDTFDRTVDNADIFYIDSTEEPFITGGGAGLRSHGHQHHTTHHHSDAHGFPKLYLRNAFVDSDQTNFPVVIERALNLEDFSGTEPLQTIEVPNVAINFEKALLTITDSDTLISKLFIGPHVDHEFLRVKYTSGFTTKNEPDGFGKIYKNVPGFLEEAAILMALKLFGTTGKCSKEDSARCLALSLMLPQFLDKHIRFVPAARKPLNYP